MAITSLRVASFASRILADPASTPKERSLAGSDLEQHEPTLADVLQRNPLWGYSKRSELIDLFNRYPHGLPPWESVKAIYDR
jgi:hypothetical protein